MSHPELSEQEIIRRNSLEEIRKLGIDPYPAETFEINTTTAGIKKNFKPDESAGLNVRLAGRLMSRRIMGSASFAELQDSSGRIQIYLQRDTLCPGEDKALYNVLFKKLLDIGDIIGIDGEVFVTHMGEITIKVRELRLLSKSLHPLPVVKEKDGIMYEDRKSVV